MNEYGDRETELAEGEPQRDPRSPVGDKRTRAVQWGSTRAYLQGANQSRLAYVQQLGETDEPRSWQITCSRNLLNPGGPPAVQPTYTIRTGFGADAHVWTPLAPGTYVVSAIGLEVICHPPLLAAATCRAWIAPTDAPPTLVLP